MTFCPYQVDFSLKNTAKTLGFSKKRVSFKFGLASQDALSQGLVGAQCRGSEHEVTFLWSLKSGKRQLFLDGKPVHFSESGMNGWTSDRAWQHAFPLKENATGRVYKIHFISQPANKEIPELKPFDIRINGVSYFSFNEIWKLGTPKMLQREAPRSQHGHSGHSAGRDSPISPEERRAIADAKLASLREFDARKGQQKPAMQHSEQSLISFDDPPPPQHFASSASTGSGAPQIPPNIPPRGYNQFASSLTMDPAIDDRRTSSSSGIPSYGQPPPPPNPYGAPPPTNPYGAPPPNPYGAPPPSAGYIPYGAPAPGAQPPVAAGALTTYNGPVPSPYAAQQPPPAQSYGYNSGTPNQFAAMTSPSAQSYASYGSAPSFARPPPAPAAAPANPYGAPPAGYPPQQAALGYPGQAPQQQYPPQYPPQYAQQPGYPNQPTY
jgi:hypothetical protein